MAELTPPGYIPDGPRHLQKISEKNDKLTFSIKKVGCKLNVNTIISLWIVTQTWQHEILVEHIELHKIPSTDILAKFSLDGASHQTKLTPKPQTCKYFILHFFPVFIQSNVFVLKSLTLAEKALT